MGHGPETRTRLHIKKVRVGRDPETLRDWDQWFPKGGQGPSGRPQSKYSGSGCSLQEVRADNFLSDKDFSVESH